MTKLMDKIKVIITSPCLDPKKNIGGISTLTSFLINKNSAVNYIHFELGKYDGEMRGIKWTWRNIKSFLSWFHLIWKEHDAIIHFNLALDKPSILRDTPLIFYAKILKRRILIHLHGGYYMTSSFTPKWILLLLRSIFSGESAKIVLSPIEEALMRTRYSLKNIIILPNSIDLSQAGGYEKDQLISRPLKVLFLGRIIKRKGIAEILEALKVLKEKKIQFKYILAGTGDDLPDYLVDCKSNLGDFFEYRGVVSGYIKWDLLRECDIFLLPSLSGEGLPIALLECMAFKLVPIVTDDGSMKYVIQNNTNGIFVEKGSASDIARSIENLNNDREKLMRIGENASRYITENHSSSKYITRINEIYTGKKEML